MRHIEKEETPPGIPAYGGDLEEAEDRADDLGRLLNNLCHQIEISDFKDGLGHSAKMNKTYLDAREFLGV